MAMESNDGMMEEHLLVTSRTVKCMVKEFLPGLMVEYSREITSKTKNRAMEFIHTQMGKSTQDFGSKETNMG